MSNKREREKRREERLQQESSVDSGERRTRLLQMGAGAVFLAIVAVVVLIVINSSSDSGGDASNLKEVSEVEAELDGIPQQDMVLGDPRAKVELIEYGDLQCPACKQYAEEILPPVIENQVEIGQAKIVFRNFTIIGPESLTAGAAALAAGAQGRGWNYVELFYRNQGKENAGYADDEFLTAIAKGAGVKDIAKWNKDRASDKTIKEVEETSAEAQTMGLSSTPSFVVKGPGTDGLELIGSGSTGELEAAIDAAS
jgi:protein-disulfide isomerase